MADNINTLVDDILKGNYNNAENILKNTLVMKQNDALDQEKIKIANQLYDNVPPEEDDEEEIDLTDEEIDDAIAELDDEDDEE